MRNCIVTFLILILSAVGAVAQEQLVKDKFVGRILVIRNFYIEPLLRYDGSGHIKHHAQTGDWTIAQFKIEKGSLSKNGFTLKGKRIAIGYNEKKDSVSSYQLEPLTIKVEDLPASALTEQKLDELTHQIFVVLRDEPETVPDYWRDTVLGNVVADTDEKGHKVYRLKSIPRRKLPQPQDDISIAITSPQGVPIYYPGGKVTLPRIIEQRDPEFSDFARKLRYEGTTILMLTISEAGAVEGVTILKPAGFGLDDNAVSAVKGWIFQPSTLDGKPVKVMVTVEVSYSLRQ